jgi:outer membrane protein assembly factor BamB
LVTTLADDWPQWRGSTRDGISHETNRIDSWPAEGPDRLWTASIGIGFSSVAVAQGRLYTLGNTNDTDTVWCLDAATGAPLWHHDYPCPLEPQYYEGGPGSTPTVEDGRVYTVGKRGQVFCFDAASGHMLWQRLLMDDPGLKKPRWGFASSALVQDDRILLNAGDAGLALNRTNGAVLWRSGIEPSGYATPVPVTLNNIPAVLIFAAKALIAVTVADGTVLWRHPWVTKWDVNSADPIVVGDRVFVSSFDRGGALLRLRGTQPPEVLWEKQGIACQFNTAVYWNGCLYGIDGNSDAPPKDLRCIDWETGRIRWQEPGFGLGSVFIAAGQLVVLSDKGELAVANASPDRFDARARAHVIGGKCWTAPVLANGRLYCRNAAGQLLCLRLTR